MEINRRSFMVAGISAAALGALSLTGCGSASTGTDAKAGDAKAGAEAATNTVSGTVNVTIDMTSYEKGKVVRAWLPLAQDQDYQKITNVAFNADGEGAAEIATGDSDNKMLYVEWGAEVEPETRIATLSFHAEREEARIDELKEEGEVDADVKEYLEGSEMVPVNDQVIAAAEEIVGDEQTVLGKARTIYDWIIANMNRDESVTGCGTGDICTLLETKGGKCTDINSTFVGLCRAVNVPAREMFGVRMNAAKITGNQHCWAEFYLPGTGWVPVDPADVLKAVLKNGWEKDSKETQEKAEYFWGGWDAERVELSRGRDVNLSPKQADAALNDFGYPYAEVDGKALDYYDSKNFVYAMTFAKDAPAE